MPCLDMKLHNLAATGLCWNIQHANMHVCAATGWHWDTACVGTLMPMPTCYAVALEQGTCVNVCPNAVSGKCWDPACV